MRKYFPHISAFIFTFALVFAVSGFVFPQTAHAGLGDFLLKTVGSGFLDAILFFPGWIAIIMLQLASLLTGLAGLILNYIVWFTIVDMANKISGIGTIDIAWKTVRDIANMAFIFVLLYAAIRTILGIGSDTKKLIVNIVVVAILINFSLFFTKVVIDASNVLAITFYEAIAPEALSSTATTGLSNSLMQPLKLQSLWNNPDILALEGKKLIIIGIMGTIVSLIAAFVFFAVAIMFLIRFVILIFVMILSPLAFMGFILPQLKQYKDQWLDALLGQAFFAPIYFMLTWIVIIVSRGLLTSTSVDMAGGSMATAFIKSVGSDGNIVGRPPLSSIAILVNFIIVIVLLIASLIIAKKWADKAGHGAPGLTKWATGAAGGATFGMVARGGRNIIGSRAAAMADDDELKKKAAEGNVRARLQLAMANKTAKSSFDLRGAPGGKTLEAGLAKKGGFIQDQKDRAKKYERYKPSKDDKDEAEAETAGARNELNAARKTAAEEAKTAIRKPAEFIEAERQLDEARDLAARLPEGLSEADLNAREAAVAEAEQRVKEEKEKYDKAVQSYIGNRITTEQRTYEEVLGVEHEMASRMENMAKMAEDQTIRGKIPFIKKRVGFTVPKFVPTSVAVSGKDKAQAIRAASKGKSNAEKLLEDVEKKIKDEKELETPPTVIPTPPPAPPTP